MVHPLISGSALQEQLNDVGMHVEDLRLKLEDARTALITAGSFSESLQSRYEEVSAEKIKLEDEVTKVRMALSNRSTDSEACQRDEQLFQLKDELRNMQERFVEAQHQSEKELSVMQFAKEQDEAEAATRATELEAHKVRLQGMLSSAMQSQSGGSSKEDNTLEVKIQQLRGDRDELRSEKAFLQHEFYFALKAAEADRTSALEDLQQIRTEMQQATTAQHDRSVETQGLHERLQVISIRLDSVTASFATATNEKQDLADRLEQLQLELNNARQAQDYRQKEQEATTTETHRLHDQQVVELMSRLAAVQDEVSSGRHRLVLSNRARSELEASVEQLQSRMIQSKGRGSEVPPQPREDQDASGSSSDTPAMVKDLEARVQRRNSQSFYSPYSVPELTRGLSHCRPASS